MSRRIWTTIAVLLGSVVVTGFLAGPTIAEQFGADQVPDPAPPEVVATYPPGNIPELTQEEEDQIVSIAEQDPHVREAVGDRDYHVEEIGVWHVEDSMEKIGGGVIFRLAEPATIEMHWPTRKKDPDSGSYRSYSTCNRHYRATNVTELHVLVDLNREKVASMRPGHDAEIVGTPEMTCSES